jgi:hypothetical protein
MNMIAGTVIKEFECNFFNFSLKFKNEEVKTENLIFGF